MMMKKNITTTIALAFMCSILLALYGCNSGPADTAAETAIPVTISQSDSFEDQVSAYIKNYPYQETYKYIKLYTGGSVKGLNVWFYPPEPSLTKAGEDSIVRMNNDTFYNGLVLDLSEGPVTIGTEAANDPIKGRNSKKGGRPWDIFSEKQIVAESKKAELSV